MNHRPSRLDWARIALRKRFPGEINRRDRELRRIQRPQIFRQQPHFLELRRRRRDRFADGREGMEFRPCSRGPVGRVRFDC